MRVKQLIKKLQKCKPNAYVYTCILEKGSASYKMLTGVYAEQVVFSPRKYKGRQTVNLINYESEPLAKDRGNLKKVI